MEWGLWRVLVVSPGGWGFSGAIREIGGHCRGWWTLWGTVGGNYEGAESLQQTRYCWK